MRKTIEKTFCDICEKEAYIARRFDLPLEEKKHIGVNIILYYDNGNMKNNPEICIDCFKTAINNYLQDDKGEPYQTSSTLNEEKEAKEESEINNE